jgi:hypothetical protein
MPVTPIDPGAPASKPAISDTDLADLAARIVPVVPDGNGTLHHIKPVDLRSTAFTWAPELTGPAANLEPIATIVTYHTYGYFGLFKPSVAEVLAQLPTEVADVAAAFSTELVDSTPEACIVGDYHRAVTTVYTRA